MLLPRHVLTALTVSLSVASLMAAPPAKKSQTKPKANKPTLSSKGTKQLPGEWCVFGKSYTLGKSSAINFILKSAEYRVGRIRVGDSYLYPRSGRKLLIIRGSLHNCMGEEQWVVEGTLDMTAVDGDSQNFDFSAAGVEPTQAKLDHHLKPAQKIDVYYVIEVPAKGEIPKLMVANNQDPGSPVARYDLRGKVAKVEETYRDPSDKTGCTALDAIPCQFGQAYEMAEININMDSPLIVSTPFPEQDLAEGSVNLVFMVEVTNYGSSAKPVGSGRAYEMLIEDADGLSYEPSISSLAASTDRAVDLEVEPLKTVRHRVVFSIPKGVALRNLTIKEEDSRKLSFDLSSVKS